MENRKNELLKKYTTLKIGGIAKNFYIPKSIDELLDCVSFIKGEFLILGCGSNLLINDKKIFENVIYMKSVNKFINIIDGIITVGTSVRIQELINFANNNNFGGIEYLYSVPASVGGAIYMNAGRGKEYNKCISDYIIDVDIFDGKQIKTLKKNECKFEYRKSIFKEKKWIILSARFKFDKMEKNESDRLKNERIKYARELQDNKQPNAGSVFRKYNNTIMNILKKIGLGWKEGISFSKSTINWLNNNGSGNYKQAKFLIDITEFIHKMFMKDIELEYIIWK